MKNYLFDTNVIIDVLRGNRKILQRLLQIDYEHSYISEITVIEVLFGAYISGNVEAEVAKAKQILSQFNTVSLIGAEETFCQIKAFLRKQGTPIEDADLMIASTALANEMTLVSNNTKHLCRVSGLVLEDWR